MVGWWDFLPPRTGLLSIILKIKTKFSEAHSIVSRTRSTPLQLGSKWLESMRKFTIYRNRCLEMRSKTQYWSRKRLPGFTAISPVPHPERIAELRLDFLGRDNVLEVALGLIIGGAFTGVVTSLVSDIILPPISLITQSSKNLVNYFLVLRPGETPDAIYNTIEQAADDGNYHLVLHGNCDRSDIHGVGSFCPEGLTAAIVFLIRSQSIL